MSHALTKITKFVAKNQTMDRNMTRPLMYGALDFFKSQTDAANCIISKKELDKIKKMMPKQVNMPVIDKKVATVGSTRTCTVTSTLTTSRMVNVTFATKTVGFSMYPQMYTDDEISYDRDFNRQMEAITSALAANLDTLAVTALETNKTKVLREKLYYNVASDTVKATFDQREVFLGDANTLMMANSFNRRLHVIATPGIASLTGQLREKGMYNVENKQLEYNDKVFHISSQLTKEATDFLNGYIVEDGNVAMLINYPQVAIAGQKVGETEWGLATLPGLNMELAYMYNKTKGDFSSETGRDDMTCDVKEDYQFTFNIAFITAFNSDTSTIPNPIIKFSIGASGAEAMAKPVRVVTDDKNPIFTKAVS